MLVVCVRKNAESPRAAVEPRFVARALVPAGSTLMSTLFAPCTTGPDQFPRPAEFLAAISTGRSSFFFAFLRVFLRELCERSGKRLPADPIPPLATRCLRGSPQRHNRRPQPLPP